MKYKVKDNKFKISIISYQVWTIKYAECLGYLPLRDLCFCLCWLVGLSAACSVWRSSRSKNPPNTFKKICCTFRNCTWKFYILSYTILCLLVGENVTTLTQLNSWVWYENGFSPPTTTTTTRHHRELNVSNISAVWPDFNQTLNLGFWDQ